MIMIPADIDDSEVVDESLNQQNDGTLSIITALLPCAINCFRSFSSACGDKLESAASQYLMYTSTLVHMMMDILGQEDECTQETVANSIATLPGVPNAFVHMLWGSSC